MLWSFIKLCSNCCLPLTFCAYRDVCIKAWHLIVRTFLNTFKINNTGYWMKAFFFFLTTHLSAAPKPRYWNFSCQPLFHHVVPPRGSNRSGPCSLCHCCQVQLADLLCGVRECYSQRPFTSTKMWCPLLFHLLLLHKLVYCCFFLIGCQLYHQSFPFLHRCMRDNIQNIATVGCC